MTKLRYSPPTTATRSATPPWWLRSGQQAVRPDHPRQSKDAFFARFREAAKTAVVIGCLTLLAGCSKPPSVNDVAPVSRQQAAAIPIVNPSRADEYAGSETCATCHQQAYEHWQQSHHAMAMAVPDQTTVLGDFNAQPLEIAGRRLEFSQDKGEFTLTLDSADGSLAEFRVAYTFGVSPLQQYLTDVGAGRLQALPVVWDSRDQGQGWYHLEPETAGKPDDVLHWTGTGQNWNHMCAACHSTQVRKQFDPHTGGFDTTFAEVSVGCEACHGPGLAHSQQPQINNVITLNDPQRRMAVCASCHSRRAQIAEGFMPGQPYLDYFSPALLDDGLYFADGQILDEVFVHGSFLQSKMHGAGVTCGDCHNPHTGQLQRSGNEVCTACHSPGGSQRFAGLQAKVYDSPAHHFHPSPVRSGPASDSAPVAGTGAACVDCHMTSRTYMGVDDRRDHSFRIPRPDLSVQHSVPNACTSCHEDRDNAWAAQQLLQRFGHTPKAHFAQVIAPARAGKRSAREPLKNLAQDSDQPAVVRGTALSLLGQYGRFANLADSLDSADPLIRLGALRGISAAGPEDWPLVLPLLRDPLRGIRFAAVTTLLPTYQQLPAAARAKLDVALEEYLAHLDVDQDRAEALTNRSLVHQARGALQAAEQDLALALKRNPSWVPALVNLADLYRATGRDVQAGELLQQALTLSPQTSQVRVASALWFVRQGNLAEALTLLTAGHEAHPDPTSGYVLAVALSSADQPDKAMDVIDDLIGADIYSDRIVQLGVSLAQRHAAIERLQRYQALLGS